MCTYVYVCFVIGFIPFFAPLIPRWNHSAAFPEKVWQCRNAPMQRSGKNIAKLKVQNPGPNYKKTYLGTRKLTKVS